MAIDMWSLGCILAELYTGYALLPGEDESDQLACIIELLGMPPQKLLDQSKRAKVFISAKGYPRYCSVETLDDGTIKLASGLSRRGKERRPPGAKELKTALKGCDDNLFLNFLRGCLEWDPELRMTPSTALKHAWFRRRLPRPPHFTSTVNVNSSPSNVVDNMKSNNGGSNGGGGSSGGGSGVTSLHLPTHLPPQIPNNSVPSMNSGTVQAQYALSTVASSGATVTPSRSSNKTTHLLNNINGSASGGSSGGSSGGINAAAAATNKLRVHLSSSDESMLSYNNRSTTSVHSTGQHRLHHSSLHSHHNQHTNGGSGTTKLPQIQQGNTVT